MSRSGRVVWTGAAAADARAGGPCETPLRYPSQGEALLDWLIATTGAESEPAPVVLLVHRRLDGSDLLITARRLASQPVTASSARPTSPAGGGHPRRLVGFKRKRTFLFDPARVLAFELRSGLVHATFDDGESYTTNYSIRELTARLGPAGFFRIHRDVIVNLKRVKEIERAGQGRVRLLLDTPDALGFTASRPASARLRRLLRF